MIKDATGIVFSDETKCTVQTISTSIYSTGEGIDICRSKCTKVSVYGTFVGTASFHNTNYLSDLIIWFSREPITTPFSLVPVVKVARKSLPSTRLYSIIEPGYFQNYSHDSEQYQKQSSNDDGRLSKTLGVNYEVFWKRSLACLEK